MRKNSQNQANVVVVVVAVFVGGGSPFFSIFHKTFLEILFPHWLCTLSYVEKQTARGILYSRVFPSSECEKIEQHSTRQAAELPPIGSEQADKDETNKCFLGISAAKPWGCRNPELRQSPPLVFVTTPTLNNRLRLDLWYGNSSFIQPTRWQPEKNTAQSMSTAVVVDSVSGSMVRSRTNSDDDAIDSQRQSDSRWREAEAGPRVGGWKKSDGKWRRIVQ